MTRPPLKPFKRRPYTKWKDAHIRRIREGLRDGYNLTEMADIWGIPRGTLWVAANNAGLMVEPKGMVRVVDVARDLGLSVSSFTRLLKRKGISTTIRLKCAFVAESDVAALRASREHHRVVDACPAGYVTKTDLMKAWGLSAPRTLRILAQSGLPYVVLNNPARQGGPQRAYNAWDVEALRPPQRIPVPADALTTDGLSVQINRSRSVIHAWVAQGMPRLSRRGPGGASLFRLPEVIAWFCQHSDPRTRHLGNYLARQERAA